MKHEHKHHFFKLKDKKVQRFLLACALFKIRE